MNLGKAGQELKKKKKKTSLGSESNFSKIPRADIRNMVNLNQKTVAIPIIITK